MGLFGSPHLKELESSVQVGLLGFHTESLRGISDSDYLREMVWGQYLTKAQEAARRCVDDGSERRAHRLVGTIESVFMPELIPSLRSEARRWTQAVFEL